MSDFKAILKQEGGCDYSIGCGIAIIDLEATDYQSALNEIYQLIEEEYSDEWGCLSDAVVYEISGYNQIDVKQLNKTICEKRAKKVEQALEQEELKQLERLKAKYDNR